MNFLAHTYLSFEQEGLLVGNYLGDFIKNREIEMLPERIKLGVRLHRSIDTYTDTHEIVKKGTSLLHASMGKYAPVVLDIYFDFFLSKHWSRFHDLALADYCATTYKVLVEHQYLMSERLASRMHKMVADRWLENYQSGAGLERVFSFLAKRATFPSNLLQAPEVLIEKESALEEVFFSFFPELILHCQREIADIPLSK